MICQKKLVTGEDALIVCVEDDRETKEGARREAHVFDDAFVLLLVHETGERRKGTAWMGNILHGLILYDWCDENDVIMIARRAYPMVRSSTSQALRSLSSMVLVQELMASCFLSSGSIKSINLPPWGLMRPVRSAAATALQWDRLGNRCTLINE